jgi:hypothetical protein
MNFLHNSDDGHVFQGITLLTRLSNFITEKNAMHEENKMRITAGYQYHCDLWDILYIKLWAEHQKTKYMQQY